ncbi:MAG: hypothetical protein GNW80_17115 [Asgard group archaeon]|nr:hypothetical protein [Asgard group archaeon]
MDIDKDIHEPARLMILSYLFVLESADFIFLRGQTGLTWGNLSSHITKFTDKGKEAFLNYRAKMKEILG